LKTQKSKEGSLLYANMAVLSTDDKTTKRHQINKKKEKKREREKTLLSTEKQDGAIFQKPRSSIFTSFNYVDIQNSLRN